jgi:uncharacterized protein
MKILVTGATGFIGQDLVEQLLALGHEVICVSRDSIKAKKKFPHAKVSFFQCDLVQEELSADAFNGATAVVHLLGESIDGYWTQEKKQKIMSSREQSSKNLLKNLPTSVQTIVTASAQGIYGNRADQELTETSAVGQGFLAEVCKAWEKPFHDLKKSTKAKVVIVRIGLVLDPRGGALNKLIKIFSRHLGAVLGTGDQWMSWISLRDLVRVFVEALQNENLEGVVNGVQPNAVRNKDFTASLCKALKVIQLPRVPTWVLRPVLGDMASLILDSQKVQSVKLKNLGFEFQDDDLDRFFQVALKTK